MPFKNVLLIGCGLIGCSLTLALKETKEVKLIHGYDLNDKNLEDALEIGAIDKKTNLDDVSPYDLIILATPVEEVIHSLNNIIPRLTKDTLITDVGSTKFEIIKTVESFENPNVNFIGGHPMAGSEKSGPVYAQKDLFEGKPYILIKSKCCSSNYFENFKNLIEKIGTHIIEMDAKTHDEIVSVTSHLPQVVAFYLVKTLQTFQENNPDYIKLIGSGFKDTTRIAKSDPNMWLSIFKLNKDNIINALDKFEEEIEEFKIKLENDLYNELLIELENISKFRSSID